MALEIISKHHWILYGSASRKSSRCSSYACVPKLLNRLDNMPLTFMTHVGDLYTGAVYCVPLIMPFAEAFRYFSTESYHVLQVEYTVFYMGDGVRGQHS